MNAVTKRLSASDIVSLRNEAIEGYRRAHDLQAQADEALRGLPTFSVHTVLYSHTQTQTNPPVEHNRKFRSNFDADAAAQYVDRQVWPYLLEVTGVASLMDEAEVKSFAHDLHRNQAPATLENVEATLTRLYADAASMWRRGIVRAFSKLDPAYKSHDGWRVGKRLILGSFVREYGWYTRDPERHLMDVERVLYVLDGETVPSITSAVAAVRNAYKAGEKEATSTSTPPGPTSLSRSIA